MPLFDDVEAARRAAAEDLEEFVKGRFDPIKELEAVDIFTDDVIGAEGVSVVGWRWELLHTGKLQGMPATGKEVVMEGVTIINDRGSETMYSRYIDWLGLYAQLGAVTIARPPVDDREQLPAHDNFPHVVDDPGVS